MQIFVKTLTGEPPSKLVFLQIIYQPRENLGFEVQQGNPCIGVAFVSSRALFCLCRQDNHPGGGVFGHHRWREVQNPGQGRCVLVLETGLIFASQFLYGPCVDLMFLLDCRNPSGPAAPHLCRQAAGGWPDVGRLQHTERPAGFVARQLGCYGRL